MHDYAIDRHPKQKVLFMLAFVAILATPVINSALVSMGTKVGLAAGWMTTVGTVVPVSAFFGLLYVLFDRYLWKWSMLRRVLLVPDLNGEWECRGRTALKKGAAVEFNWVGTLTISQSWSKILVHLRTTQSSSRSMSASIYHDQGVGYRLLYQYKNEPRAGEQELQIHTGSVEMDFEEACRVGQGHYFTDSHRNTVGVMDVTRRNPR